MTVAVKVVGLPTTLVVPVWHQTFEIGAVAFFVVVFLVVAGAANAVNLTDGLDGLAAGIAAIVLLSYTGIAFVCRPARPGHLRGDPRRRVRRLPLVQLVPGRRLHGRHRLVRASAGRIAAMAVMTKTEILLVVIGAIFVAEALSVIIQVIVFKRFRRRVFLMTPVHHHFEMAAWSETKIIVRFWLIAAIFARGGLHALLPRPPEPDRGEPPRPRPGAGLRPGVRRGVPLHGAHGRLGDRRRPSCSYALDERRFTETFRFPAPGAPLDAARARGARPGRRAAAPGGRGQLLQGRRAAPHRGRGPRALAGDRRAPSGGSGPAGSGSSPGSNGLPGDRARHRLPGGPAAAAGAARRAWRARSLVPIGGGKDSAVALAALARAGEDVVAFSVGRKPSARRDGRRRGRADAPRRARRSTRRSSRSTAAAPTTATSRSPRSSPARPSSRRCWPAATRW